MMPTPTYTLIEEQTLSTAQAAATFTNIPSTYRHLELEAVAKVSTGGTASESGLMRFNADSGTNYSTTFMYGNGSTVTSGRVANQTTVSGGRFSTLNPGIGIYCVFEYANTNVQKTVLSRGSDPNTSGLIVAYAGVWRSNQAITTISVTAESGNNWVAGATFRLWGIN